MYETTVNFTIGKLVLFAQKLFCQIGIANGSLDARLLMAHIMQVPVQDIFWRSDLAVSKHSANRFISLVSRRLCFEPIAYLINNKEFFGRDFAVSPACLIPRPDTECVVEEAIKIIPENKEYTIFDIGTGSGAIGISILAQRTKCLGFLSDISSDALKLANNNATKHGVSKRCKFFLGDLFGPFKNKNKHAHMIISNPPYIDPENLSSLMPDVRDYEPMIALNGLKPYGMSFYFRLISEAPSFLVPGGMLILEIGCDQKKKIQELASWDNRWCRPRFFDDLSGRTRGVLLKLI